MSLLEVNISSALVLISIAITSALCSRIFYNLYLSPLSIYPGPWYAASTSLAGAVVSLLKIEPRWLQGLAKKYGTDTPIRISPTMLLFPKPASLKDIYRDPKCNTKSGFYGSGVLGPPHLFTTLDGDAHRSLRKALGGPQWSTGSLKNEWESRIDDKVQLFIRIMSEKAKAQNEKIILSDKVAEFAADIVTMIAFTESWGFVENSRDERGMLASWRNGLDFFGFAGRFRFFRERMMKTPGLNTWLLPRTSDHTGMGFLMSQADHHVTRREKELQDGIYIDRPDLLQYCLESRLDGEPLTPQQKRAHVTLIIQAGADTTGTAMGSTLRFIATNPRIMQRAKQEIRDAASCDQLSTPVQFEETRVNLPYIVACIRESLRLNPPAPNLLPRVVGKEGKRIDEHFVPAGTDITSNAYVVQRDPELYAPDPDSYRPERWLESIEKANEMEAGNYVFGMGPRVCLGKDIAIMELYKLIPEILRRFDIDVINKGRYIVAGGVGYNQGFEVKLTLCKQD
ncbi:cytochrome P450 monooxygenase [Phlyctema vagabunda]|uniref:Cytochrome P450 monooxygenase n=1 Tax=Phlyctema vagabunda TaxID=108571 RepID=A0ABR4PYK6_9HELO